MADSSRAGAADVSSENSPQLVFIHGFLDEGSFWAEVVGNIKSVCPPRLTTIDLPGMGLRANDGGNYGLPALRDFVLKAIAGLSGPQVLIGHSMGAQIAEIVALYKGLILTAGSSWGKAAYGRYQGIAYLQSDFYRCRLAVIVEVSGKADALKVERMVGVCDSGLAVNPLLAERAVEAGMIFGLSNAMYERITLAGGAPEQTNFDTYPVLRIDQTPDVIVEVISVGDDRSDLTPEG
jgi:pimeloyl-ACP methyl ester carboxylesterase